MNSKQISSTSLHSSQKKLRDNQFVNSGSKPKKTLMIPPPVLHSTFQTSNKNNYDDLNMCENNMDKKVIKKKNSSRNDFDVLTGLNAALIADNESAVSSQDEFELIDKINLNNENCFIKPKPILIPLENEKFKEKKAVYNGLMQQTPSESSLINSNAKSSKIISKKPNSTGSLNSINKPVKLMPSSPRYYFNENYYDNRENLMADVQTKEYAIQHCNANNFFIMSKNQTNNFSNSTKTKQIADPNFFKHIENFYKPISSDVNYANENQDIQKIYKLNHLNSAQLNTETAIGNMNYADLSSDSLSQSQNADKSQPEPQLCQVNLNMGKIACIKNFSSGKLKFFHLNSDTCSNKFFYFSRTKINAPTKLHELFVFCDVDKSRIS